jgi:hypothetical protein
MTLKMETAINTIRSLPPQDTLFVAKGEKLGTTSMDLLAKLYPGLVAVDRQKMIGQGNFEVVFTKDVMKFLTLPITQAVWGIIPLNQLVEWAIKQKYPSFDSLRKDFKLYALGGGECTVELAINPNRTDLINSFNAGGFPALAETLRKTGQQILTDTEYIAKYTLGPEDEDVVDDTKGSLEALMRFFPAIIGIVQSGNSLIGANWLRLADSNPKARILSSQNMLVINNQGEYDN